MIRIDQTSSNTIIKCMAGVRSICVTQLGDGSGEGQIHGYHKTMFWKLRCHGRIDNEFQNIFISCLSHTGEDHGRTEADRKRQ
jgi:hypothetical protein